MVRETQVQTPATWNFPLLRLAGKKEQLRLAVSNVEKSVWKLAHKFITHGNMQYCHVLGNICIEIYWLLELKMHILLIMFV